MPLLTAFQLEHSLPLELLILVTLTAFLSLAYDYLLCYILNTDFIEEDILHRPIKARLFISQPYYFN